MEITVFDLETHEAEELFTNPQFVRLGGLLAKEGVMFTPEVDHILHELNTSDWIAGHNILGFDLLALAHHYGADWETLAEKSIDTLLLARLAHPPMARDTGGSVDRYSLDAVAERLGVPGKTADLKDLAKKHGGFGSIPVDDPEFRAYLEGDLEATAAILDKLPRNAYARREHKLASLAGRMTLNGFRVDEKLLRKRITEGEKRKQDALTALGEEYGLPLGTFFWTGTGDKKQEEWEDFDSPLRTLHGRKWLLKTYSMYDVTNPPRTPTGQLSTSAEGMEELIEQGVHPDLERMANLISIVTRIRTVYQTVDDHLSLGRVHALNSMGQASGRWSVTKPGLTVFGKRGGKHHERDIFIPEEDHEILSADLSQVDMRAIAAHCQDPNYMKLFEVGAPDVHAAIAKAMFGTEDMREPAKRIGHGANYGLGKNKLIRAGFDPDLVTAFFRGMERRFPVLMQWRDKVREIGYSGELLNNGFGRLMRCDPARAYTQAPALMGQGTARDIMCEALLRLPDEFRPYLRVMVHDEIVMSVPRRDAEEIAHEVKRAMTFEWRGVPILVDVSKPGKSWGEVSDK